MCGTFNYRSDDEFYTPNNIEESQVLNFVKAYTDSTCKRTLSGYTSICETQTALVSVKESISRETNLSVFMSSVDKYVPTHQCILINKDTIGQTFLENVQLLNCEYFVNVQVDLDGIVSYRIYNTTPFRLKLTNRYSAIFSFKGNNLFMVHNIYVPD